METERSVNPSDIITVIDIKYVSIKTLQNTGNWFDCLFESLSRLTLKSGIRVTLLMNTYTATEILAIEMVAVINISNSDARK